MSIGYLRQVPVSATVEIGNRDDMRIGGQSLQESYRCRQTGGEGERVFRVFESCDGLFKAVAIGVG